MTGADDERMTDLRIELAGETVWLLPERALFWPRTGTVVAADLHWGKAATFRAAGIPLPPGTTTADLARLDAVLDRTEARSLVILGDLFHAAAGRAERTLAELHRWRTRRAALDVLLVRGNHDRHAGDPPATLEIECRNGPVLLSPFVLRHEPGESADGYTLAGHVHPGLTVVGEGLQRERLPCFVVGPRLAVLPAFGGFTGLGSMPPTPATRYFVIAGSDVIPLYSSERA
jgi:DNA ligase-associated metallophosphoesterase